MGQELRPYQQQARGRIHAEWEAGRTRTLLVLPTGTGKTIVFASVAADQVRAGDRVLILAHRGELLEQAADKLQRSTGLVSAVEKAESTCLGSWFRVVVGSVQTLQRTARLERFPQDYFGTIIIDEAHHAITDGYRRILDYFDRAKVLGVTATPDRGDMRNLGEVFDSLAFEYKLTDAIKEGYLCKIMAQTIPLKLDITDVGFTSGDYSLGQLGTALDPYLEQIAAEMAQRCRDRKTVVFLPLIKTSQKFSDLLNAHGFRAAEVNGPRCLSATSRPAPARCCATPCCSPKAGTARPWTAWWCCAPRRCAACTARWWGAAPGFLRARPTCCCWISSG